MHTLQRGCCCTRGRKFYSVQTPVKTEGLNRLFCVDNAVLFKYFPLQDGAVQAHGHEASRMCRVQTEKRKPSWPLRARQNVPKMCP